MKSKRLIYKDEFGDTHTTDEKIGGKFIGDKAVREKLFEYEQAESEGKLINLPCKVGKVVFIPIFLTRHIACYTIIEFVISNEDISFVLNDEDKYAHPISMIGKDVFLTWEEADKALKERENNESLSM